MALLLAPVHLIGGHGGSTYKVKGWESGNRIAELRVYSGEWQIKAIRLWLTGDEEGHYQQFGDPGGANYQEFTFEEGERVEKMSLWGNGAGSRAGWIYFRTNKGRSFDYGMYGWPKKQEYEINVGSGILVGAVYNAGADIDSHGYYFLSSSVASSLVRNVSYPTLSFDTQATDPVALDSFTQTNHTSSPISWKFQGKHSVTSSQVWTATTENAFEVKVSVEAEVPLLTKVGGSFGWRLSAGSSHQRSEQQEHSLTWENSGQLQPGQTIGLVASTRRGKLNVPYTATAMITLRNGATFSFPQEGTYQGIVFSAVEVNNT